MLKNHCDTQCTRRLRVAYQHGLAIKQHVTSVRLHRAVNHLHEGGFTGTVLTQNGMNFTGLNGQVNPVVGNHAGVCLG